MTGIKQILGFSYNDLPYYLRSCLLYFGMYPEDYNVKAKRLIRQWIAEGFVKEERGYSLEEVAERYLSELVHRSLVQVSSLRIDGNIKSCCVHDLIRMMILEKCGDLSFSAQISEDSHSSLSGTIRRLSITTNYDNFLASIESSRIQSLVLTREITESRYVSIYSMYLKKYTRLKMLDIEGVVMNMGPECLKSMIHLKYLSFKDSYIIQVFGLLKRVATFKNLETLDLRINHDVFSKIPKEIGKLRKLRHFMGCEMSLLELKDAGIGGMKSLQTLSEVRIDMDGKELISELGKLRQLRKLSLVGVRKEHGRALSSLLNELQHLETLRVGSKSKSEFDLEVVDLHLVSSLPMLRNLKLRGKLDKLPQWIHHIQNLTELKLACSKLTDDSRKCLEKMKNLLFLSINENAYENDTLHFHDGGFQNLKELHITDMPNLKSIVFHYRTLPSLKKIVLSNIPDFTMHPHDFENLEKLEVLNFMDL